VKPVHGNYVEVEALDGDLSNVEIADTTPDDGLPLNSKHAFTSGRAVIPDYMPTKMRRGGPQAHPIPDFDNGLVLNVSGAARDLIEAFEPGVHQFIPVDYFDRRSAIGATQFPDRRQSSRQPRWRPHHHGALQGHGLETCERPRS
jgi:hypothetical protein